MTEPLDIVDLEMKRQERLIELKMAKDKEQLDFIRKAKSHVEALYNTCRETMQTNYTHNGKLWDSIWCREKFNYMIPEEYKSVLQTRYGVKITDKSGITYMEFPKEAFESDENFMKSAKDARVKYVADIDAKTVKRETEMMNTVDAAIKTAESACKQAISKHYVEHGVADSYVSSQCADVIDVTDKVLERFQFEFSELEIEVEETPGQAAVFVLKKD